MWLAYALLAITCAGTVFMMRFLIALLREGSPSVCYWVIPSLARKGEEPEQRDSEADFESDIRNLDLKAALIKFMEVEFAAMDNLGSPKAGRLVQLTSSAIRKSDVICYDRHQ